jgi:hypothetical protein
MANDANTPHTPMDRAILHTSRFARQLGTTALRMCDAYMDGTLSPLRTETLTKICARYGVTISDMYFTLVGLND